MINQGQETAICHRTGPLLVLAGPGSGKTYTITRRVRRLIEEDGVAPDSILVITFTRAAAGEMKQRFVRLTDGKHYPVTFGTFHAIYYHILRTAYHYRSGHILSETEKREILKTILISIQKNYPEEDELEAFLSLISRYKNEGCPALLTADRKRMGNLTAGESVHRFDLPGIDPVCFQQMYQFYSQELKQRGKLDFDDMVLQCRALFREYPNILAAWQQKFQYILVDEFQDINLMQYEVLRMLAAPQNNLFVVGDDDQSIYAFRGARPEIMRRFLRDYPTAGKAELAVNYRSTPEIVSAAGRVIRVNRNRIPKKIQAEKTAGESVCYHGCRSREDEIQIMLQGIEKDLCGGKTVAAIFRTNQQAGPLAERMAERGISFSMREKLRSPYRSEPALDLLAYFRFIWEGQKRGDFYRIMNKPVRYIRRDLITQETVDLELLEKKCQDKPYLHSAIRKLRLEIGRLRRMDLFAAVNYIRKGVGYDDWVRQTCSPEKAREWLEQADWFQDQMKKFTDTKKLQEHIAAFDQELQQTSAKEDREQLQLLTMHASKGLEFDSVYIPYCNDGIIPHKQSVRPEQIEEERRMFYVAMTRAREKLTILWFAGTKEEPGLCSRFLNELLS